MKSVKQFFGEVRLELARVEWPRFQEFVGATLVVLFLILVFAVYLGVVDRIIVWLIKLIFSRSF